jgi:Trypsin
VGYESDYEVLRVSLGVVDIKALPEYSATLPKGHQNIKIHPQYTGQAELYNIALVLLPETSTGNINSPHIGTVLLPHMAQNFYGPDGMVSGFGRVNDTTIYASNELRYAPTTVVPTSNCESNILLVNGVLCGQGTNGRSACIGDNGGPLIIDNTNILSGLVDATSTQGCTINRPVRFVRVGYYLDWISEVMGDDYPQTTTTTTSTTTGASSRFIIGNILIGFCLVLFKYLR